MTGRAIFYSSGKNISQLGYGLVYFGFLMPFLHYSFHRLTRLGSTSVTKGGRSQSAILMAATGFLPMTPIHPFPNSKRFERIFLPTVDR